MDSRAPMRAPTTYKVQGCTSDSASVISTPANSSSSHTDSFHPHRPLRRQIWLSCPSLHPPCPSTTCSQRAMRLLPRLRTASRRARRPRRCPSTPTNRRRTLRCLSMESRSTGLPPSRFKRLLWPLRQRSLSPRSRRRLRPPSRRVLQAPGRRDLRRPKLFVVLHPSHDVHKIERTYGAWRAHQ